MKKGWKKVIAILATVTMTLSIGMPAFATVNTGFSENEKQQIRIELNEKYNVQILPISDSMARDTANTMSEEEFKLRTELLAISGAIATTSADAATLSELNDRYAVVLQELQTKYPNNYSVDQSTNKSSINPKITIYEKTKTKSSSYLNITSDLQYTINPSIRFLSADNIRTSVKPLYDNGYTVWENTNDPYWDITLSGTLITISVYGELIDYQAGGVISTIPQFVSYTTDEL